MDKMIYISPLNLSGINSISELANNDTFLKHLDPIDYHFVLFSSLYQSGANYFQLDINYLPKAIKGNKFWKDNLWILTKRSTKSL
jgi:hypothetical protein